jgi:PAS domain S-box-containing protein
MLSEKERLEKAVDSVVGIIFFNSSGAVIGSNEVFRQVTGYTREEIESGKLHWRMMTPPEWVPESERQMEQFASTGRIGPYEKEYWLKNGSRRWMLFAGRKLDEDTIIEYCVDITARKHAEMAAEWTEQRRKQLIADLAHGLNNPLETAIYALHMLRGDITRNPAAKALVEALERIRALSHQLIKAAESESQPDETESRQRNIDRGAEPDTGRDKSYKT